MGVCFTTRRLGKSWNVMSPLVQDSESPLKDGPNIYERRFWSVRRIRISGSTSYRFNKSATEYLQHEKASTSRRLKEPIWKGAFGGCSAISVNYVHPTVECVAGRQCGALPLNKSCERSSFFKSLLPRKRSNRMLTTQGSISPSR